MMGRNEITLNMATMQAAVQHYFDTVLFREGQAPRVGWINSRSNGGSAEFAVTVTEREEETI